MTVKTIASGTVADAYLALLADRGIDYLFANAGTDFAPIIEALAKAQATGTPVPKPVTVPHENVAVGMALGHYLKSGRPQAVMVHVNVGTANAMCGLLNASRANIPFLMTAGRTPYSEDGGLTGARTGEIHWPQEMRDQRGMVREMVKWDYELPNAQVLEATVDRALNVATSEPAGPIYLTLPREVLAAPIPRFPVQLAEPACDAVAAASGRQRGRSRRRHDRGGRGIRSSSRRAMAGATPTSPSWRHSPRALPSRSRSASRATCVCLPITRCISATTPIPISPAPI